MDIGKIALIFGAGASKPYGLPLGGELLTWLRKAHLPARQFEDTYGGFAYDIFDFQLKQLSEHARAAAVLSIDKFAEHHDSDTLRTFVASSIGYCEEQWQTKLPEHADGSGRPMEQDWVNALFEQIRAKSLASLLDRFSGVITFNYDRLFEHFATCRLAATFGGMSRVNAWQQISTQLSIVHYYGTISGYQLRSEFPDKVAFGRNVIRVHSAMSQNLEFDWQGKDSPTRATRQAEIATILGNADKILIFGVASALNDVAEMLKSAKKSAIVAICTYGCVQEVQEFAPHLSFQTALTIANANLDAAGFVRQHLLR